MKNLLTVIALLLIVSGCKKQASDSSDQLAPPTAIEKERLFEKPTNIPKYKEGEVLVKFRDNLNRSSISKMKAEYVQTKTMQRFNYNGYYKVKVDNVESEVKRLQASGEVEWVSPNWTETILDFQPNDPFYTGGNLYGLGAIKANLAWNSGNVGSKDVYVVVIDEGSMYWHCDLYKNIWENPEEVNGTPLVDDDHNGYVDDFRGWNWFNGNNKLYTGNDDHGTHVAGTIAAKGNNGIGVIGVAPNVKIISLKFLADFGYDDHAIKAIDYAIDLKLRKGLNIKVMSNSWGGGGFNQGLIDAIDRAKAADILFVCAAGNSNINNDTSPSVSYPASYPNENIISVGASDGAHNKASFSNYGKTSVDLFAPGVNIYSTLPSSSHTPTYGAYSGTSMATPHVSGGIALLSSVNPELSWSQLKATIMSTVTPVPALSNYCITGGVLNVSTFTGVTTPVVPNEECGTPPVIDAQKPSTMTLKLDSITKDFVTGYAFVYLSWERPTDNSIITGLLFSLTPYHTWFLEGNEWDGYGFNVAMNQVYNFNGRAIDSWGNYGDPSNVIVVDFSGSEPPTDNIPPSIPQNLRASEITTTSFLASWNASTDNIAVKDYKVLWRPQGQSYFAMTFVPTTSFRPLNLLSDTIYEFAVIARDGADNMSDTSASIFVRTNPNVVIPPDPECTIGSTLSASSQALNVTLSFTATSNCTIQSKRLERKKGGNGSYQTVANNPSSPYIDAVPNPGQYTYRLVVTLTNGEVGYSNEKQIQVKKK